ncbi:heterodimeric geranylgeranyl pyrophosphate synthase small subunit, chloroplastic-like [Neltuma alba]|uniref:heterodimeric geranylgeranyl pyrophosphate synthase small subunit, chloroplastic-like n=1 Tax=Neltuma alba TaxID=207710 RepID=UPI0010A4A3C1|nr:heterodimeric geranylgeranyl pyrophosphate synthase small subunit, chloroplastic-like [Prosopis alba]
MVGALFQPCGNSTVQLSSRSDLRRSPLPSKLTTAAQITRAHSSSWASLQADIEAHLKQAIPMKEPLVVFEPMHHLAFTAPRTTVPALCVAACELVGGHQDRALPAASALLLMQAVAYTHEHLPLTDRPRPKARGHHEYDPNIELLTGDGMIPLAFELLARSDVPTRVDSDRILRVMVEISRAVGSEGLVEGQYRKFVRTQLDGEANIKAEVEKGEGGMHACGAACGAVLGDGSEEEIEKLRNYGLYVGMMQGMMRGAENAEKGLKKELEEIRKVALGELEFFEGRNIEVISRFIDV